MANKVSDAKREEMWAAWQERQAVQYVATKVQVSRTTVRRYREHDAWDARLAEIRRKAEAKGDETAAERRARYAKMGRMLQVAGQKYFVDARGKLKEVVFTRPADAIDAIEVGVRMENEAYGDPGAIQQHNIVIERIGKSLKDMTDEEVVQEIAGTWERLLPRLTAAVKADPELRAKVVRALSIGEGPAEADAGGKGNGP